MNLTLHVWRQKSHQADGAFVTYNAENISSDASFLEMLDVVNEGLIERGDEAIHFEHDCREGICGSCGMMINGKAHGGRHRTATCQLHMRDFKDGDDIWVEPWRARVFPVIKDLIVDMDAVHWKKIQRVTPWLLAKQPVPEREYLVSRESMVDVTQTMACIQCGSCVSDCLAMEVDPGFIGPAALAKTYRFVGDPRDDQQFERLNDLAQDPQGIFDCTHCFKCVDACPKDVNPMGQIMRLRRIAIGDHHIVDKNNGERHEAAFTTLVKENGLLWEAELLPRSYGGNSRFGKFAPAAGKELLSSLPAILKAVLHGKVTLMGALKPHKIPKRDLKSVQAIYEKIESRKERYELNLYITGQDEDEASSAEPVAAGAGAESPAAPTSPEGSANQ